jgi:RHS repeat-associated protein
MWGGLLSASLPIPLSVSRGCPSAHQPWVKPFGYTQKERDSESALHYFEARYLSTSYGRFLSVDPLLSSMPPRLLDSPQLMGAYSYAFNRPLVVTDPTGAEGVFEGYADRAGVWMAEHGGVPGAMVGAVAYSVTSLLDPTANAVEAMNQFSIARDPSASTAQEIGGWFGTVGYGTAAVLDVMAVGKALKQLGRAAQRAPSFLGKLFDDATPKCRKGATNPERGRPEAWQHRKGPLQGSQDIEPHRNRKHGRRDPKRTRNGAAYRGQVSHAEGPRIH